MTNTNPFWGSGERKDFGSVAVAYGAGRDVVLDQQFVQYECLVNEAHQVMLAKTGILPRKAVKKILSILKDIKRLDAIGQFILKPELEDVHSNVEQFVISMLGVEIGGNLRLGIARNDQIYTDTRMYLRDTLLMICNDLIALIQNIATVASTHTETVMPGYTHLRISQPITYGHWLVSKCCHFLGDLGNLFFDVGLVNKCPLGIFEMAGTHLPIDRHMTAALLGFEGILENSLYAANTRGEIEAKVIADYSLLAMHMRRALNELMLWSTHEFGYFEIDDLYTTGGTAQPNLKNPDTLEVMRANCAKVHAKYHETLSIMDNLPSGFNRDTQETKSSLIEANTLISGALPIFTGMIASLKINKEKMLESADLNFGIAPDVSVQVAVMGNISFREAYKVVKALIKNKVIKAHFSELTTEKLKETAATVLGKSVVIEQKHLDVVATATQCVLKHTSTGGPAPKEVKRMIKDIQFKIKSHQKIVVSKKNSIKKALAQLAYEVKSI